MLFHCSQRAKELKEGTFTLRSTDFRQPKHCGLFAWRNVLKKHVQHRRITSEASEKAHGTDTDNTPQEVDRASTSPGDIHDISWVS